MVNRPFLKLWVVALMAAQPCLLEARDLKVELIRAETDTTESSPLVRLSASGGEGGRAEATRTGFGAAVLRLSADPVWTLRADVEGYWSVPAVITADINSVRLVLWPAGRLVGSLAWPTAEETPELLKVRFDPSQLEGSRTVAGRDTCSLFEEGRRFVCILPAGKHDFAFRVTGYVSIYLWDQILTSDEERDLGTLKLVPGSSVAGWVETLDGRPFNPTTLVELKPQLLNSGWADPATKLDRFSLKIQPNAKGFFHFAGVAEGLYSLRATQEGCAEAVAEGIEVVTGYESRLPYPLVLGPPRELEVRITPNTDSKNGNWYLRLTQLRREKSSLAAEADCDDLGFASLSGMSAGKFWLMVFEEESRKQPFHLEELELDRLTTFLDIELPIVKVEGTLLLGEEPLSASLLFGGSFSPSAAELHSDEDGNFHGHLPREGEWKVKIESEDPPVVTTIRQVMVKRKANQETARVTLQLPDLQLTGSVVDEAFEPVRAMVQIRPEGAESDENAVMTADDGTFELHGLPEGRIHLTAGRPGLSSDEMVVDLVEGRESRPVQLVVRMSKRVLGVVVSSEGQPVPGASVGMRPWSTLVGSSQSAVTNAQGEFEIELAESTKVAHVMVKAPGYALLGARYEISDVGHLVLNVNRNWGQLEISFPKGKDDWVQVARAGGSFQLSSLMHWARLHVNEGLVAPGRTVVPRLALGTYLICFSPPGSAGWSTLYAVAQNLPDDECVSVDLQPFARKSIELVEDG